MITSENNIKEYSWGLDISTTNIGMSLWDEKGELVELKHLALNPDKAVPEEDRYIFKAELFKKYIKEYKEKIKNQYNGVIENIFVEKPLPNTKININTTSKLLAFNGIACYVLFEVFEKTPLLISVYDSRKLFNPELIKITKKRTGEIKETLTFPLNIDKKLYIWRKVNELYPNTKWFYTKNETLKNENFDMSDSIVVSIAGLIVMDIINKEEWEKINDKCVENLQQKNLL